MLINKSTTKASTELWNSVVSKFARAVPEGWPTNNEVVRNMKLAALGFGGGRKSQGIWATQRYEDFARKTESLNQEIEFDKKLMDDALRWAAWRIDKKGTTASRRSTDIERMLSRVSNSSWLSRFD